MAEHLMKQGYFSILRWRSDPVRDEARNVAIILVGENGEFGGVEAAPISRVSSRLNEQGLLDSMIDGLSRQFQDEVKPDLAALSSMHSSLTNSLIITEPQPVAVKDEQETLQSLYKALVAPKGGGGAKFTKGAVLDNVIRNLRRHGLETKRGNYIDDFIFDVTIEASSQKRSVMLVLSFAGKRQDWSPMEKEAGHFLYALENVDVAGTSVFQPPIQSSTDKAYTSFYRVTKWCESSGIKVVEPEALKEPTAIGKLLNRF